MTMCASCTCVFPSHAVLTPSSACNCALNGFIQDTAGGDDDDEYDVPDDIESVIELLLVGLRDKDTIVR